MGLDLVLFGIMGDIKYSIINKHIIKTKMKVTIENPKTVVVVPEQTKTVSEINIKRMVDFPERKMVVIYTDQFGEPITLWEGDAYDAIGDWTNADVELRLKELYQS